MIRFFQIFLAKCIGGLASVALPPKIMRRIIRIYAKQYKVNLSECDFENRNYKRFNDFFTRHLLPNARSVGEGLVSPVDATIYASGQVKENSMLQVKSQQISVSDLLCDDQHKATYFMSFYLSPGDYHRYHAPFDLSIETVRYIPGKYFSVRPKIAKKRKVFLKNERVVLECNSSQGKIYLVYVAAQNVGKIELKPLDSICPKNKKIVEYKEIQIPNFKKGDDMGAFHMGSSVVLLTEEIPLNSSEFEPIKVGQTISS